MTPSTDSSCPDQQGQQQEVDTALLPSYTDHNGFRMPEGFPVDGFISGLAYEAQPNDLFVATYPKCGTTWMQHLIYLILHDGNPVAPGERLTQFFPHLEEVGAEFVQKEAKVVTTDNDHSWRLVKTHLPYEMTPKHAKAKYIFVARNPKDCVVSFFHHTRGFVNHYNFANGSFDTFFKLFINGQVDFGDYFHCLRSWMDHRNDSNNLLFVTYEALRANLRVGILQVAEFLDADCYPARLLANDEAILKKVVAHSSLDEMKKDPLRWSSERPKEHAPFVRKGSVGGWDELLTLEQANQLDGRMMETCTADELKFLGPHYYDSASASASASHSVKIT